MGKLGKFSLGIGDRFAHQGNYQLEAIKEAYDQGVEITPVWNKSFREHKNVGSTPESVRKEADQSVLELEWEQSYLVDADHITLETVDDFIASSDFFTIDVVEKIGQELSPDEKETFFSNHKHQLGDIIIDGIDKPFMVNKKLQLELADKYYNAALEVRRIYDRIKSIKGDEYFAVEVSIDEVNRPQTPIELYFILLFLSENGVPLDTIAPKFPGRFNKGVDYEGNIDTFGREFEIDLLVINHARRYFRKASELKLSIHTGSDKFSLYPVIKKIIKKYDVGLHLKTAGTTWLEELIGLAESGDTALDIVKSIYSKANRSYAELTSPYKNVLNIDRASLPDVGKVMSWEGRRLADAIKHDKRNPFYNPHLRQLLHTAYKIAAEKETEFLGELEENREIIGRNVKHNILERHIKPLFMS